MAAESEKHVDKKMKKGKKFGLHKSGVMYVGHLPHGFYEEELKSFFSQFGAVNRVRVVRSRKTGRSKGYAFVEFKYEDVAKIAIETMNNYLLYNKILKCSYVQNPRNFWPKSFVSTVEMNKKTHNTVKSEKNILKRKQKILKKIQQNENALAALGIRYKININNNRKDENEKMEESSSINQQDDDDKSFEATKTELGKEMEIDKNESLTKKEHTLKRKKSTNKIKNKESKIAKFEKEIEIDDTDEIVNEVTDKVMKNTKFSPKECTKTPDIIKNVKIEKETSKQARERNIKSTKLTSENSIEINDSYVSAEKDSNKFSTQKKKYSDSDFSDFREEIKYTKLTPKRHTENNDSSVSVEKDSNKSSTQKKKKKHCDSAYSGFTEEMNTSNFDEMKNTKLTPKSHTENNDSSVSGKKDSNKSSTQKKKKKHCDSAFSSFTEEMNTSNFDEMKYTKLSPKESLENSKDQTGSKKTPKQKTKKNSDSHSDFAEDMNLCKEETKHTTLFLEEKFENDEFVKVKKISENETKAMCDIDKDIKNQKISTANIEASKTPLSKTLPKRSPKPRTCKKSKQLNITDDCVIVEMPDKEKKKIEKSDEKEIDKDRKITGILSNSGKKKKNRSCKKQSTVKFNEKNLDNSMNVKSDFHQLKDSTTRKTRKSERDIQALSSSYIESKTTLPKRSPKFRSCKK
ncbi:nucleolar protein 4-like [Centruroides sculpturatus]|uniref:nucleolar protein 4-like n=1 Tax=Centruroides sculpturatus TaxID=218467 RepID=UPI000C6EF7CC|nr:nucleolar protein 4-like [Centruroides sculpturatus]